MCAAVVMVPTGPASSICARPGGEAGTALAQGDLADGAITMCRT